ncbi:MAG TPA: sigma-54 dependent transcriptional regulator [Candidatus Eisenbacteria bacterium]|nr:sigma-54 dependent transcriptional regulator [Candidatus Eisenbacteria bacterium]
MKRATVVVIDDELLIRKSLTKVLKARGYKVESAPTGAAGLTLARELRPQVAILDMRLPDTDGLSVLRQLREAAPDTQVVVITAYGDVESAVEAMKLGASDFVRKPYEMEDIVLAVQAAEQSFARETELDGFRRGQQDHFRSGEILGESTAMREVRQVIAKVAASEATSVLIEGESGTGKELVARAIHDQSDRRDFPLVEVNCSQFQESLLNNELFGHERGAFTDAREVKKGLVEVCENGTLFLDEVGEMPLGTQAMLLRFIDSRQFKRVGGTQTLQANLRIVTATNKKLEDEVERGRFREDLFYRLQVVSIHLPPLRERGDDVLLLARQFLREMNIRFKKSFRGISEEAEALLMNYSWPGNVRQLRNVLERAVLLEDGDLLLAEHLPPEVAGDRPRALRAREPAGYQTLAQIEEQHIKDVLRMTEGNKSRAARILGIARPTLIEKIKRMEAPDVREGDMSKNRTTFLSD